MPPHEAKATHSAYLELKEERMGMEEGYRFLDEKRLILAAEIVTQLARYEQLSAALRTAYRPAREALKAAIGRHGLEGLGLYPVLANVEPLPATELQSVLGVAIEKIAPAQTASEAAAPPEPIDASPEAEACRNAFRELLPPVAELAVLAGNLARLREEYTSTARRARAMEDVILPEIDETLHAVAAALEELEREEIVRVRRRIE